ncbi:unnamed protein product, partial [Arabidopsis halleri]
NRWFCGGVAWVTGDDDLGRADVNELMDGKMLDGLSSIIVNDEAVVYTVDDTKGKQRRLFIWMRRWAVVVDVERKVVTEA